MYKRHLARRFGYTGRRGERRAGQHLTSHAAELADCICHDGWLKLQAAPLLSLEAEINSLAAMLGAPIAGRGGALVERLTPQGTDSAKPKSLSVIHGRGAFPLHTDGAHRLKPPRFLLLACANPGSVPVPTVLRRFCDLGLSEHDRTLCESATFLVRNGRQSFYSTVAGDRPFVRFDEGCMIPIDPEGEKAANAIVSSATNSNLTEIHWEAGDILAIDNWQVLHGRGHAKIQASSDRLLFRISV